MVDESSGARRRLSRRAFLRMTAGAAVALPAGSWLTACSGGGGGALGGGETGSLVTPTNDSPWVGAYKALVAKYQQESGVEIDLRVFPYDGLRTQMTNVVQSGNAVFDVFQPDEPWTAQFYDSGWVTPLDEIDSSFKLDDQILEFDALPYWDADKRVSAASGRPMGLPLNGNLALLMYRKDLYEELNLSVPRTWEEAWENGKAAQESGKVKYGYTARGEATQGGQSITYDYMPTFYSYGANWFAEEGVDWTPTVNSAEAVAASEMYRRLLSLGPQPAQTVGQDDVIAAMQSGDCLQAHIVAAAAPQLEDESLSNVAGRIGYAVVPAGPAGSPAPTSGTWSLCVPKGIADDQASASLDFINWVLTEKAQVEFTKAGGIPTRRDAFESGEIPSKFTAFLNPLAESMPHVRRAVRYTFAAPMLVATERSLSAIVAGSVEVEAGLDKLQQQLTQIVKEAGLL
jgi:multiple sugar transport system substrate-binding protein